MFESKHDVHGSISSAVICLSTGTTELHSFLYLCLPREYRATAIAGCNAATRFYAPHQHAQQLCLPAEYRATAVAGWNHLVFFGDGEGGLVKWDTSTGRRGLGCVLLCSHGLPNNTYLLPNTCIVM